ncbi:Gfo/Idh/MocA family oxidoreductase [bacterium]|nr:Gfo/Idh/MocA family oxidoreductase [bacterium]
MKFLVIGCGSIGKRHIGNLVRLGVEDIWAFDLSRERVDEVREQFCIRTVKSLEEAWECNPDAAIIAVPTSLHLPLATEAAEHGCHLFVEKPLSHSPDGVNPLLRLVQRRGLVTLVGCNMRFHPGIRYVKSLVDEEAVGHIVAARVEVGQYLPDWHPGEDYRQMYSARRDLGGGIILDAIHEIDYIRWMLGEVGAVACFTGKLSRLEIDTEDTAAILLRFESGAIGELHLDYIQRTYSRSCHIIGEEGTIRWDFMEGMVRWYSAKARKWEKFINSEGWEPNQMYLDEMVHFLRCLEGREKPMLDVIEAKRVLDIALAAKVAAEEERIVRINQNAR